MTLGNLFDKYVSGLDEDLAKTLVKWKHLIFGRVISIQKMTNFSKVDIFQDLLVELVEEYKKYQTPQYTYKGHSYVLGEKTLGAYVWIQTPSWNKKFQDGRWILREQLILIQKSSLESYMYRQITQFHTDYLGKALTSKRGYSKKTCGKINALVYSGTGKSGTFTKEIDKIVCKPTYKNVCLDAKVFDGGQSQGDFISDSRIDIESEVNTNNLLEVMSENMSKAGYEHIYRKEILGEHLTLTNRGVMMLSREVDLVKRVLEGNDPLRVVNDGVAPVKFGLGNVE